MARSQVLSVWMAAAVMVNGPGGMELPAGHSAGMGSVKPIVPLRVL